MQAANRVTHPQMADFHIMQLGVGATTPSAPALAAALRRTQRRLELSSPMRALLRDLPLVQMYRISGSDVAQSNKLQNNGAPTDVASEAQAAAHVLLNVADRLRRLAAAYGEWGEFDPCAYFDLLPAQAVRLLHIAERVSTVHVTFYTDLLLPSFQTAEAYWQEEFRSHYLDLRAHLRHGDAPLGPVMAFSDRSQPQMQEHWARLLQVIGATRGLLDEEMSYWAANGSSEERARWRWAWASDPAPGVAPSLLPPLRAIPTLTLAVDFPLPAYRQPGRLRRLRRLEARRRAGRLRPRSG